MNRQDWIQLGYSEKQAKELEKQSKIEENYERQANLNYYSNTID